MKERFVITKGEIFKNSSVLYDRKTDKEYVLDSIKIGEGNDSYDIRVLSIDYLVDILNELSDQ